MSESFEQFKQAVSAPDAFSSDDVLDKAAREKLGGPILTNADLQYDGQMVKAEEKAMGRVERKLKGLTATSEFTHEQLGALHKQLFAAKQYDFLYENKRIKSISVLCRQLREVLSSAGMSDTDIQALFSGELKSVINQLATYEAVAVPKAAQAQEEMSLRSRLLSTATARFFATTKRSPAEVMAQAVPAEHVVGDAPQVVPENVNAESSVLVSNRVYEKMEDQEQLAVPDDEERQLFLAANARSRAIKMQQEQAMSGSPLEEHTGGSEVALPVGDNIVPERNEAGTIEAEPMNPESPKNTTPAEVLGTSQKAESSSAESADERSVASLMAQADRLIALTRNRREKLDISHKDAKAESENYAAARSEITKIKNRLRAILADKSVAEKRAEVAELRSSLAGHLWALREDFPLKKDVTALTTEDVAAPDAEEDPLAEQKAAATEVLRERFTEAYEARQAALRAGMPVRITLPDGRNVEGETELIHDNGTTLSVSWLEDGVRTQQVVARDSVMPLTQTEVLPPDGTPMAQFSGEDTLYAAAAQRATNEMSSVHEESITTETVPDDAVGDKETVSPIEPDLSVILPEAEYTVMAREAGADVSPQLSVEAAVARAREKLDEKIAETGSYRNSILAGTEGDRLMTLKQKLQTIEERLVAAKASPEVMRPEEVQALRSQLADVEYALNQIEALAPKKLLGLPVPRASDGPFAMRAFRDALNLEWQPLKRAAEKSTDADVLQKKLAFEGIFKILGYVPESGLTEAEATELRRLSEVIALPTRISGEYVGNVPAAPAEAVAKNERLEPLLLTEMMRVREGETATVLKEKLPGVANKEIDPKRETKARRWFERSGILTAGFLLGLLAGDTPEDRKNTTGVDTNPLESSAPAASTEMAEPTITIKPDIKPIEGRWSSEDADTVTPDTEPEVDGAIEPTITDITDRVAAEKEALASYTIKETNNLWKIAEGKVGGLNELPALEGLSEFNKTMVLSNMETALRFNADLMDSIGLKKISGEKRDPSLIYPGEVVNRTALNTLLEQIKETLKIA